MSSVQQARPATELLNADNYPTSFNAFVGQKLAKAQLIDAARSAKKRKERMPHILIASGRPGIGKTSLALLCAAEMRSNVLVVSGKMTLFDARKAFVRLKDRDVLVIDEVHQMVAGGKANAEWLLHYLQDGVLVTPLGIERQPSVTVIAATTDSGRLPETILDRFPCKPLLVGYSEAEAAKIAQGMAVRIFGSLPMPTPANFRAIAAAASHNPRVIRSLLLTVRDIAVSRDQANHHESGYDLTDALAYLGLTHDGLTATGRRYLVCLMQEFQGPAGAAALKDRLQEPGGLEYTERLLMDKGYIGKTDRGRVLTPKGLIRSEELVSDPDTLLDL